MRRSLIYHFKELFWRLFYNSLGILITLSLFLEDPFQTILSYWLTPLITLHIPLIQSNLTELYENTFNISIIITIILIIPLLGVSILIFLKPGFITYEWIHSQQYLAWSILILVIYFMALVYFWPYLLSIFLDSPQIIRQLRFQTIYNIFQIFLTIPLISILFWILAPSWSRIYLWITISIIIGTILDWWWEGPLFVEFSYFIYLSFQSQLIKNHVRTLPT